jgi:hypothetical protein
MKIHKGHLSYYVTQYIFMQIHGYFECKIILLPLSSSNNLLPFSQRKNYTIY